MAKWLGAKRSCSQAGHANAWSQIRETVSILEISAEDAAPVLKTYLAQVPVVRPFFDVHQSRIRRILFSKRHGIQYSESSKLFLRYLSTS